MRTLTTRSMVTMYGSTQAYNTLKKRFSGSTSAHAQKAEKKKHFTYHFTCVS